MLGFFSSKTKIEVGSLCEVQHPVSSQWMHGSITRDEGDGYFSILLDSSEELLNHIHLKKIRKVRGPDRVIGSSEKSSVRSVTSSNASAKTDGRRFSLFGSKKNADQAVIPIEEKVEPPVEVSKLPTMPRMSSIKAMVELPDENFQKKIQRRKIEEQELLWLDRVRKCHQSELKQLDLSKLELENNIPEIFSAEPLLNVPDILVRKNLLTSLTPLSIFQSVIKLDVSFNMFSEAENIREAFSILPQLTCLRSLDLSGNSLEHIPTEIYSLTNLECLMLKRNQLRDIPSALVACSNLSALDISYNSIATIPSVFEEMVKLRELNIDHNPCVEGGIEALNSSKAGEKTIFLIQKRSVYRSKQFRRGVVQNASRVQQAVLEKEKQQIVTRHQPGVRLEEFD